MEAAKNSVGSLDFAAELWNCCWLLSIYVCTRFHIYSYFVYLYYTVTHSYLVVKTASVLHNQHYKNTK